MSDFGDAARQHARRLNYTEYEAKELAKKRAKKAGDVIDREMEEPRLDELCELLDLDTDNLENPAVGFGPKDVALAAWSNWGAGSWKRAYTQSSLSGDEFIVLNDYFRDIVLLDDES